MPFWLSILLLSILISPSELPLPEGFYRVSSCPTPNNLTAWKEASDAINCTDDLENTDLKYLKNIYHCMPSNYLNETLEFCGRMTAITKGICPVFDYERQATVPTGRPCSMSNFTNGCPEKLFYTREIFKYPACLKINTLGRCYLADPGCPRNAIRSITPVIYTTTTGLGTTTTINPDDKIISIERIVIAVLSSIIIIFIIIAVRIFLRRRKICRRKITKTKNPAEREEKKEMNCKQKSFVNDEENALINENTHYEENEKETIENATTSFGIKEKNKNIAEKKETGNEVQETTTVHRSEVIKSRNGGSCNSLPSSETSIWDENIRNRLLFNNFYSNLVEKMIERDLMPKISLLLQDTKEENAINQREKFIEWNQKYDFQHNIWHLQQLLKKCRADDLAEACAEFGKRFPLCLAYFECSIEELKLQEQKMEEMGLRQHEMERSVQEYSKISVSERKYSMTEYQKDPPQKEGQQRVGQFKVLTYPDILPRYQYHRFLLDWFINGLQNIPQPKFKDCPIILGGEILHTDLLNLLGKSTGSSAVSQITKSLKTIEKDAFSGADILVVYFLYNSVESVRQNLMNFLDYSTAEKGTVLFVIHDDGIIDEKFKSTLLEAFPVTSWHCKFVAKKRLEIISQMTCILERRLIGVLEHTKSNLLELPLTEDVDTSLLEIHSILRRLNQSSCFPNLFPEKIEDFPRGEINDMLESFGDKILWHGFEGDTLHIIISERSVQKRIELTLSKPNFEHMKYSIKVQDELSVQLLANTGVPLHGAKFVYVNNGLSAFLQDKKFATTGSLMVVNGSRMVVVTCRHAFREQENIYVLVDDAVVGLGQMTMNSQQTKNRLCEDITLVELSKNAISVVNEKCEKLLIGTTGLPTPAVISLRELKVGDIVHKRGAKTGLTTGIVKSVQISKLGGYQVESQVIQICGRGFEPFAAEGDSGALVFQHSLSPDENVLDVLAIVQSKLNVPVPNAPVVCFPFTKGCETLYGVVPGLQTLQFANV